MSPADGGAVTVAGVRIAARPDPWKAMRRTSQTLTLAMKRKLGLLT